MKPGALLQSLRKRRSGTLRRRVYNLAIPRDMARFVARHQERREKYGEDREERSEEDEPRDMYPRGE